MLEAAPAVDLGVEAAPELEAEPEAGLAVELAADSGLVAEPASEEDHEREGVRRLRPGSRGPWNRLGLAGMQSRKTSRVVRPIE